MESEGANKEDLRRRNRGLLLKLLSTKQCHTRTELSKTMNLSKMAITKIAAELLEHQILEEKPYDCLVEAGRRPIQLVFHAQAPKIIGVLIVRNRCEAVLCDLSLRILDRVCETFKEITDKALINTVYRLIDRLLNNHQERILGIGVSSIGAVDSVEGVILEPLYFYGIKNIPIVELLEHRYGLPVRLDQNNQCAVLAEKLYGNGNGYRDIFFLALAEGVGSGVIANDVLLYAGRKKLVSEFGHTSIDINGIPCICGQRGCIERYINTRVLKEKLYQATSVECSFKEYCKMTHLEAVDEILSDAVQLLCGALTSTINILNSEIVLLGEESVYLPEKYLKQIETSINKNRVRSDAGTVVVRRAKFLDDAQLLGAAAIILSEIFCGNKQFPL